MQNISWKSNLYALLVFAFVLLLLLSATPSRALMPPAPEEVEKMKQDGTLEERIEAAKELGNHKMDPELLQRANFKIKRDLMKKGVIPWESMVPPLARQGMPTTGTINILVVCINFNEYAEGNTIAVMEEKIFGVGDPADIPYDSMKSFYLRSSYNQLTVTGNVLGWKNMGNRSDVSKNPAGRESLIMDVLDYYDGQGHDFSQYDNNGDGAIDYFVIFWTGHHTGWSSFWWAHKTSWYINPGYTLDGKTLDVYSWNYEYRYAEGGSPGEFVPRTIIHETGHGLGLPDYYDYDDLVGPPGGVGGEQFYEYFIVENRNQTDNQSVDPGTGLVIWHVDSTLNGGETNYEYDNSFTEHKLLRLMEADGLEEIEGTGGADAEDFYTTGDVLGPYTTPNTNMYGTCFPAPTRTR